MKKSFSRLSRQLTVTAVQCLTVDGPHFRIGQSAVIEANIIYVAAMIDLGRAYVDFDTWLNR